MSWLTDCSFPAAKFWLATLKLDVTISMLTQTDLTQGGDKRLAKDTIESITKAFKAHYFALDSNYVFI
jgi:hypothetical protein